MTACEICGEVLSAEALAMGWPILAATTGIGEPLYTCPHCYGTEAFCAEGHVLPAHSDADHCPTCDGADDGPPPQ